MAIEAELAAKRRAWAASLLPYQTELLGHVVMLPEGVEPVEPQEQVVRRWDGAAR